ncbi:hypothetical protein J7E87_10380 [Streptomyces sp. ISL-1]|uniref:hypothetical protein n=1 Tax=Streptomyces sp. ISL-1 TaxID=2817657 RepID=UPI001BEA295D|nr:hypothetical protein [Streptomyces sp. ISL-1]MBT2389827.1 hypothetical protein [Streptomyces sp. ISL-1]
MSAPPTAIRAAVVIAAYQVELDDPVLARAPLVVTGVFAAAAVVVAEADGVPDGVAEAVGEGEADPEGLAVGSPLGAVPRSGATVILDSASRNGIVLPSVSDVFARSVSLTGSWMPLKSMTRRARRAKTRW